MKKLLIIILVILLAAMAIAVPVLADESDRNHGSEGLENAISQVEKDSPAFDNLIEQCKRHGCGGGGAQ